MTSFLIVKTSAIGDVIQTFPVVEYLRLRFPDAKIDWVVEKACYDLVKSHPCVDQVLVVDTKRWRRNLFSLDVLQEIYRFRRMLSSYRYQVLFDLQGNSKSALITAMAGADQKVGFGMRSVPEKTNLLVTSHRIEVDGALNARSRYLNLVQNYFQDLDTFESKGVLLKLVEFEKKRLDLILAKPGLNGKTLLMVSFGSNWKNKRLDDQTLRDFLQEISQEHRPSFVFIWGSQEEKMLAEKLQEQFKDHAISVGELSLPLWQNLMEKVKGIIATDSAGLHLAGSANVPTFSIFGPSSSKIYKPVGQQHVAFQGSCPYGVTFEKRCPKLRSCPTGACIRTLNVRELTNRFRTWYLKIT